MSEVKVYLHTLPLGGFIRAVDEKNYLELHAALDAKEAECKKLIEHNLHIENKISNRCADLLTERQGQLDQARAELAAFHKEHAEDWKRVQDAERKSAALVSVVENLIGNFPGPSPIKGSVWAECVNDACALLEKHKER